MPVDKNYTNCKTFLMLELETRVIAMGMTVLGIEDLSDDPKTNIPPSMNASSVLKKLYLYRLSNMIYENYISEATKGTNLMKALPVEEEVDALRERQSVDKNGRYPCRFPNCNRTYAKDGKRRRDHENSHVPLVHIEDPVITCTLPTSSDTDNEDNKKQDDMYQYNICLTRFGLICGIPCGLWYLEFHDAIKEGDGNRIFTCWKFLLLLFKGDEKGSTKYALEALYLILQVNAILSPRQAYRLLWNRTIKGKDYNVPLDLDLEHDKRGY